MHTIVLVYPNTFDVGTASLGFRLVHALFTRGGAVCETAFSTGKDTGTAPRTRETGRRLSEFDVIAFSIAFENDLPSMVQSLSSSGIDPMREKRTGDDPLVVAGGPLVLINPEPLAPLVDLFFVGEGEVLIPRFLESLEAASGERRPKPVVLGSLDGQPGFYVPTGGFETDPPMVRRVTLEELNRSTAGCDQQVVAGSHFGDTYLLEVGRGCPRTCRFCAARSIYSPLRYRSADSIEEELGIIGEGTESVGLLGASLSDFRNLGRVVRAAGGCGYGVQTSSLRMDRLSGELLGDLKKVGVRTITTAPEAGSGRMRRVIRKDLSEADMLDAALRIGELRFPRLKLYYMIGLPGERDEDVRAIVDLSLRIGERVKGTGAATRITVCLSPFVPKPWTPFQWAGFERSAALRKKIRTVRSGLRGRLSMKAESLRATTYQALVSRGDRSVGAALARAVVEGRPERSVMNEEGLDRDFYLHRVRERTERFPWDHIDHGIGKEELWKEWQRALDEASG